MESLQHTIALLEHTGKSFSFVSSDLPLLSNLNIIENIALIEEVHQKTPRTRSHQHALAELKKISMEGISEYRIDECNDFERFSASLIRASMMQYATIIVISPLQQFFSKDSITILLKLINDLELEKRVEIFDLVLYENDYENEGVPCHIIK